MNGVAAYLDELSNDPEKACEIVAEAGLKHVCLRRVWNKNVSAVSDEACQKLKGILKKYDLSVILCASEVGRPLSSSVARDITIASYFKAKFARALLPSPNESMAYAHWLKTVLSEFNRSNVELLLEPTSDSDLSLKGLTDLINGVGIKLLYDPAQFMMKRGVDHFTAYWPELSKSVVAMDVHDYKIGVGHRPIGMGSAGFDRMARSFDGWWFLELGLGKPNGDKVSILNHLKSAISFLNGVNDEREFK